MAALDRMARVRFMADRKSTRLNSSHMSTSYAVFCLKKKNALWCADYKGEFQLGNRQYCYPLTITDFASRYLLTCEALSTTQEQFVFFNDTATTEIYTLSLHDALPI